MTVDRGGSVIFQLYSVIPRASIGKSFGGFFREDFAMAVVLFWHYLLPSTFLFICGCFSKLLCDGSFSDFGLKPDFVAFFPTRDALYPSWGCVSSLSTFGGRPPSIGVYRRDCSEPFDATTTPVDIRVCSFEKWVT